MPGRLASSKHRCFRIHWENSDPDVKRNADFSENEARNLGKGCSQASKLFFTLPSITNTYSISMPDSNKSH